MQSISNFSNATPLPPSQLPQNNINLPPPKSSSDMIIKLLILSAIVLLAAIGIIGYLKFSAPQSPVITPTPVLLPPRQTNAFIVSPTVTPLPKESSPEGELDNIDVGSPEADLQDIKTDLERL